MGRKITQRDQQSLVGILSDALLKRSILDFPPLRTENDVLVMTLDSMFKRAKNNRVKLRELSSGKGLGSPLKPEMIWERLDKLFAELSTLQLFLSAQLFKKELAMRAMSSKNDKLRQELALLRKERVKKPALRATMSTAANRGRKIKQG